MSALTEVAAFSHVQADEHPPSTKTKKEKLMNLRSLTLAAAVAVLGLAGCDQSKAELDKTKADLQAATTERDSLKSQLEQANAKITQLTTQVTELQAKANAAPPPAAAEPAAAPAKHAGAKPKSKAPTAAQKKEIQEHPQQRSGQNRF
jgi:hypothetical protein